MHLFTEMVIFESIFDIETDTFVGDLGFILIVNELISDLYGQSS